MKNVQLQYQFLVLLLVMQTVCRWSKSTLTHGSWNPVPQVIIWLFFTQITWKILIFLSPFYLRPFYAFKCNDNKKRVTEYLFHLFFYHIRILTILGFNLMCIYDVACPLLCLSSWLSQSPDLLTSSRGQRHSRGPDIPMLSIFYIQVW